jgi:anti-anti-sigma factor
MPSTTTTVPITATRRTGLTLSTEWLDSTVVRISASGEIDASNTAELLDYVLRRGANCRSLILDLKDVTFFGTEGFSALQTIDVRSSRASVSWTVVPGPAVSRVLKICDPRCEIPRGVET